MCGHHAWVTHHSQATWHAMPELSRRQIKHDDWSFEDSASETWFRRIRYMNQNGIEKQQFAMDWRARLKLQGSDRFFRYRLQLHQAQRKTSKVASFSSNTAWAVRHDSAHIFSERYFRDWYNPRFVKVCVLLWFSLVSTRYINTGKGWRLSFVPELGSSVPELGWRN